MTAVSFSKTFVWVSPLSAPFNEGTLSQDEQRRASTFRRADDQRRFMAARSVLRQVLGWYCKMSPSKLCFYYGANGKPGLVDGPHFNLAHAEDWVAIAVNRESPVGIDIEPETAIPEADWILGKYFMNGANGSEFLRNWTRAEALRKATGSGLCDRHFDIAAPGWSTVNIELMPRFVAAVASRGAHRIVRCGNWYESRQQLLGQHRRAEAPRHA